MADLCLDEFTDHGHCGVLAADGSVDNDATLERYAAMALAQAAAGAHVVGPSGMMDGQVGVRPRGARRRRVTPTSSILAYAAKYASAFYGPFREAVRVLAASATGAPTSRTPPTAARRCARSLLDVAEGADIVMVKPAGPYLDVVAPRCATLSTCRSRRTRSRGSTRMIEAAAAQRLDRPRPGDPGDADRDPPRRRADHPHLLGPRGRRPPLTPACRAGHGPPAIGPQPAPPDGQVGGRDRRWASSIGDLSRPQAHSTASVRQAHSGAASGVGPALGRALMTAGHADAVARRIRSSEAGRGRGATSFASSSSWPQRHDRRPLVRLSRGRRRGRAPRSTSLEHRAAPAARTRRCRGRRSSAPQTGSLVRDRPRLVHRLPVLDGQAARCDPATRSRASRSPVTRMPASSLGAPSADRRLMHDEVALGRRASTWSPAGVAGQHVRRSLASAPLVDSRCTGRRAPRRDVRTGRADGAAVAGSGGSRRVRAEYGPDSAKCS